VRTIARTRAPAQTVAERYTRVVRCFFFTVCIVACIALGCGGGSAKSSNSTDDLDIEESPHGTGRSGASLATPTSPEQAMIAGSSRGGPTKRVIDIDFKNADLHNAFRFLAEVGDVNLVLSDEVRGVVTLRLRRVPVWQAVDAIVKLKNLRIVREGPVYRVSPRR